MKRILVTSKNTSSGFAGALELIYGEMLPGTTERPLLLLDMRAAVLNNKQREWIIAMTPVYYGIDYPKRWGTDKLLVSEADMEVDFYNDFYNPYGKKVNAARCLKIWDKYTKADQIACAAGTRAYLRYLSRYSWRTQKDPEGFLKNRMWTTDWDNLKD